MTTQNKNSPRNVSRRMGYGGCWISNRGAAAGLALVKPEIVSFGIDHAHLFIAGRAESRLGRGRKVRHLFNTLFEGLEALSKSFKKHCVLQNSAAVFPYPSTDGGQNSGKSNLFPPFDNGVPNVHINSHLVGLVGSAGGRTPVGHFFNGYHHFRRQGHE